MVKVVAGLALLSTQVLAQTGIIYLVRHGEKDHQGCESSTGMKRANDLYDVMKAKFDVPDYVYGYTYEGSEGWECQRCWQTAEPIAKKIGMSEPDKTYGTDECSNNWGHCPVLAGALKEKLKEVPVVLFVAEHNHLTRIAYQLGAPKNIPWEGNYYDGVFKLEFKNGEMTEFTIDTQSGAPWPYGPTPSPSPSPHPSPSPSPIQRADTIYPGGKLASGDTLWSETDNARLSVQGSDGNLVLHHANTVVWASGTTGYPGSELRFQGSDGNLVLYDANGKARWSSGKAHGAVSVQLQDDCNLVTRDSHGKTLWELGTHCSTEMVTV